MRIACSTSAFKTGLEGALAEVARLGFHYVDLIAIPGWDHLLPARLADEPDAGAGAAAGLLGRYGLQPLALNMAVGHLYQRDQGHAQRLREVAATARLMQRLNVPVASFYPGYRNEDRPRAELLADEVATIEEMLAIGGEHGVVFAVELHQGTPFETVAQAQELLDAVPALQVAYDPSHFAMQGIDLRETTPFLARAAHVHLRGAAPNRMQAPLAESTVDFAWLFAALEDIGYDGDVSLECLPGLEGELDSELLALRDLILAEWPGARA